MRYNAVPRISVPPHTSRTCSEPRFTLLRRVDHLTEAHQAHLDRLFDAHPRLRTAWGALQELYQLYQLYQANDLNQANQALGRFADLELPRFCGQLDASESSSVSGRISRTIWSKAWAALVCVEQRWPC